MNILLQGEFTKIEKCGSIVGLSQSHLSNDNKRKVLKQLEKLTDVNTCITLSQKGIPKL